MFKKEYYCLVAGLPDLFYEENEPGINSMVFFNELYLNLNTSDSQLIQLLRLPFDNENFLNIYFKQEKPFNPLGNIDKDDLELQLMRTIEVRSLPYYMLEFLEMMQTGGVKELNLKHEKLLHELFYAYALETKNSFLRNWFAFELNITNIKTALRCIRFNHDISTHLIMAGKDSEVNYLLQNKRLNAEAFEDLVPFSQEIFSTSESRSSMLEKERALDQIKWDYLDEITVFQYFTIEKILAYTIKLFIIERWMKLDKETGHLLLQELINELKTSYKFPTEFSL